VTTQAQTGKKNLPQTQNHKEFYSKNLILKKKSQRKGNKQWQYLAEIDQLDSPRKSFFIEKSFAAFALILMLKLIIKPLPFSAIM
jgi:hypothetical protein